MDLEESNTNKFKRVKLQYKCPNPLFETWLEEWLKEANERNLELRHTLKKALGSLKKYPLPFNNGRECIILEHFGTGLCSKLDRKLAEYKKTNELIPIPRIEFRNSNAVSPILLANNLNSVASVGNEIGKLEDVVNGAKSSSDTNILNLAGSIENEIIKDLNIDLNAASTSKNSANTELAVCIGNEIGNVGNGNVSQNIARIRKPLAISPKSKVRRKKKDLPVPEVQLNPPRNDVEFNNCEIERLSQGSTASCSTSTYGSSGASCSQPLSYQDEHWTFIPGTFRIVLLVDNQETLGHKTKSKKDDETIQNLTRLNVPHEVRHLPVGDFAWIADAFGKELLLPYIVERKRLDDLAKSIKDGRFHEQKFRLKQLPVKHKIYLVEGNKRNYASLPFSSLMQAVTNTQVIDGFTVKHTNSLESSMEFLATLTTFITEMYCPKILVSCSKDILPPLDMEKEEIHLMTFQDFCTNTSKKRKFTVGEMFIRHLLQLRGLSVEKAKKLVELYPTPSHLMAAYQDNPGNCEMMLAKISCGPLGRSFGPVLSKVVHDLYTKEDFD